MLNDRETSGKTKVGIPGITGLHLDLIIPAPSPAREREKQGVVNFSTHFSFEALILKPLMVTSPSLPYNWLLSRCRLPFTLLSLTLCSLWLPLQFTNSDSRVPSSPYREETASFWSFKLLGKRPSFHKPQNIIVWIKMFTCYQPCSYSDVYFGKYYIWKVGTLPGHSFTLGYQ